MANENFAETWALLRSEVEAREQRLLAEYQAVWKETDSLLDVAAESAESPHAAPDTEQLDSLRALLESAGQKMALSLVRDFRRLRPQERALAALEEFDAGLDDVARRVPAVISVTPDEMIAVLGAQNFSGLRKYLLRRRNRITLPLRNLLQAQFLQDVDRRARLDGEFFLLLAQASLALLAPWQEYRRETLSAFVESDEDIEEQEEALRAWTLEQEALKAGAARVFKEMGASSDNTGVRLMQSVRRGSPKLSATRRREMKKEREEQFRFWARRQRAVSGVVDLESRLIQLTATILQSAEHAVDALNAEHDALLDEIQTAIRWLEEAKGSDVPSEFPPPAARLLSAGDHAGAWRQSAEAAARERLPASIESIDPRRALPSVFTRWRNLQPLRAFLSELAKNGYPLIHQGFQHAEAEHRSIVREIERAREVVIFSLETGREASPEAAAIKQEGLSNALSLVNYKLNTVVPPRSILERQFVEGIALTLLATTVRLEHGRLGFIAQFARQRGSRALRTGRQQILRQSAIGAKWLSDTARSRYHWVLLKTGWETPAITSYEPVVTWEYLGDVMNLRQGSHQLPLIYRRLFRLAPVEDPRFLVARDAEFAAFGHAKALWEAHRAVSVLLVGARGSGKTSLLNCAVSGEFGATPVIRSQFGDRVSDRQEMRTFLHSLLQIPEEEDLVAALAGRRAIIVLEELERTFLRRMNGFEGLQELLLVVSLTSRTTLWILGLNDHSYRFLDAAVSLGKYFSHRINAMAISPAHLKEAILIRHNLSGLRLHYPTFPAADPRVNRIRNVLGLQQNTEALFFDSLYHQSQGIFRSAFELWQHYTDRVEGGVLYLKQPIAPDPEPLIAQFTQEDAFTLQAILQHGSLTPEDHAQIFECPIERSRIRLERLVGLECLEPDPCATGLRVRPEAGRVVHTALHRLNLL